MCQIGKGHPAELEHQSGNGLCTSQTVRLGILIQKLMQFRNRQRAFLPNVHSGIYIMKQSGDIRSSPRLHSTIINTTQHTHIGRNRIRFQTTITQMLTVTAQTLTGNLTERHVLRTTKVTERKKGILIDMRCRKAPLFL